MELSSDKLAAIGSIANIFGTRYGAYRIDRLLKSFGILDAPVYANKMEKIAHALRKLVHIQQAFCGFMTALLNIHTLSEEELKIIDSQLRILGYQVKGGMITPITLGDITDLVKLPPDLTKETQKMAEAYVILFYLENQLRVFIKERMQKTYGDNWWEKVPLNIRKECEKRKKREKQSPWHEVKESHLLWYTTFDELQRIIQTNWKTFEEYFKDQHAIVGRLNELEIPRNTIAHNRILEDTELERLRIFSHDILKVIKKAL